MMTENQDTASHSDQTGKAFKQGQEKPYNIGYVMGVFDLFHVGHLNLIRRAAARCNHLYVGLLTDALVQRSKHITPYIPYEERREILLALRYVEGVNEIDDEKYFSKVEEWKRHPFDCLFSGSDYQGNPHWVMEEKILRSLGSAIEFFPYTETTCSSKIRAAMEAQIALAAEERAAEGRAEQEGAAEERGTGSGDGSPNCSVKEADGGTGL